MTTFLCVCLVYFGLELVYDAGVLLTQGALRLKPINRIADWVSFFSHVTLVIWVGVLLGAN